MATTEEETYVYLQGLINEHSPLRHQEGSTDILPYLRELAADAATRVKAEREAYDEYRRLKKDRGILIKARETAQTNMVASAIDDMLKDVSEAVDGHESYIEESKSIGLKSITSRANQHIWAAANQINIQLDTVHNVPRAAYWTAWILHYEGVEGTIVGRNDAIAIYKEYKHHSDDSTPLTRIEKAIIGQIRKHEARAIAGIPLNMESLKLVQDTFVLARAKANNTRSSLGTPLRHVVLGMFYWARERANL